MSKPLTVWDLPREEYLAPGHRMCQGCGAAIAFRHILKATGEDVIITMPTGCGQITSTVYPQTAWRVPWIHVAFENAAAVASGIAAGIEALKRKGFIPKDKDIKVVAIGGDGGTFDIGFQALSGTLERGDNVLYICYDNEAYMNTGIQRSGATPLGAWTTTTPVGKVWRGEWRPKKRKDLIAIAIAHNVPYAATANSAFPVDLYMKVKKALSVKGPKVIHVLAPCVPGWRIEPEKSVEVGKLAVLTGMWINYEYENGTYRVTTPVPKRKPVREYLRLQGRFRHLTDEEIKKIQELVDAEVARINKLVGKEVIGPVEG
jgi:pyruvate ferredoxin oxidoreductase beta subunit